MSKGLRWLLPFTLLVVLITPLASAVNLEARIGLARSHYNLSEGATEYTENATWQLGTFDATLPLTPALRATGMFQVGRTTDVEIVKGAPAADPAGRLSRYMIGAEAVWRPVSLFDFGIGVGYLNETQSHTWKAAHPNPDDSDIFGGADLLGWSWERSTTGWLIMASVEMDAGVAQVSGRIGYGPSVLWHESTKAEKDGAWELWEPENATGIAGVYGLNGRLSIGHNLSLIAGIEGIVQQSPKIASAEEEFSNSNGFSETRNVTDLPKAFDHRFSAFVGLRLAF